MQPITVKLYWTIRYRNRDSQQWRVICNPLIGAVSVESKSPIETVFKKLKYYED